MCTVLKSHISIQMYILSFQISKGARPTINNNLNSAQLIPLRRVTPINSCILHDNVSNNEGLIMVQRIEMFHTLVFVC